MHAPGKTKAELAEATAAVTAVVKGGAAAPSGEWAALEVFSPVHHVRSRQDCVLLPFEALGKALAGKIGPD